VESVIVSAAVDISSIIVVVALLAGSLLLACFCEVIGGSNP
jgi:hypothetical protein